MCVATGKHVGRVRTSLRLRCRQAAVIRIGLMEMVRFCKKYYTGISDQTFFERCGVADLITTCFGGRNRKCAEAFAKTGKVL